MPLWTRFTVAFACAGLAMVLVRFWSQRKLRKHVRDLEHEQVRGEERQRIATDVHDDLSADVGAPLEAPLCVGADCTPRLA